jgi:adenylate cyclase, class 2
MYEVELKFPVAGHDPVIEMLTNRGARPGPSIEQRDFYFNHPQRDFAATDEALRIRSLKAADSTPGRAEGAPLNVPDRHDPSAPRSLDGAGEEYCRTSGKNYVTYKGPVVDSRAKTRREIELALGDGSETGVKFGEILKLLGFRPVRVVVKTRTPWHLALGDRTFEIALDRVEGLGDFVEIETQADESERDAARDAVLDLAAQLGL